MTPTPPEQGIPAATDHTTAFLSCLTKEGSDEIMQIPPSALTPANLTILRRIYRHFEQENQVVGPGQPIPKSPPENKAQDRLTSLQAQLDGLQKQKNRIRAVLHELTNIVQPISVTCDIATERGIKKTIEGLNREMAEILKEEYEMGLKLHRALKRQDDHSAYEPTSLWVRRVTSQRQEESIEGAE